MLPQLEQEPERRTCEQGVVSYNNMSTTTIEEERKRGVRVQLEPQLQLEEPEQPQSPFILLVLGGEREKLKLVCDYLLLGCVF